MFLLQICRLQHQLQQRANMQQAQQAINQPGMNPQGGQPYMSHQLTPQQQQDRHRQLVQQQRYMGMQRQHQNQVSGNQVCFLYIALHQGSQSFLEFKLKHSFHTLDLCNCQLWHHPNITGISIVIHYQHQY